MNITKLKEIKTKIAALKEEALNEQKKLLGEGFKELFAENPRLKCISFRGFVPYFNDGDECCYRVSEYDINGYSSYSDEGEQGVDPEEGWEDLHELSGVSRYRKEDKNKPIDQDAKRVVELVRETMSCFDDDFWREIGGDHAAFVITAEGVEIEGYTHHD